MEINDASKAIITLILGVGISILALIFISTLSGNVYNTVESDINDIGNRFYNTSNVSLDQSNWRYFGDSIRDIHCKTVNITNVSNMYYYQLSNFTLDCGNGRIQILSTADASGVNSLNTSDFSIWFNYGNTTISNSIRGGVVSSFSAMNTTANYMPIIALAIIIVVVLVLLMGGIGGRMGSGGAAL